jgi:hypothetical protein
MDAKIVEKIDRQRYLTVVLQAVALADIFVETALRYARHWNPEAPTLDISGWVGLPLLLVAGVWYLATEWRIRRDGDLRAALHNEMYVAHKRRAQQIALWVVMCALLVGTLTADHTLRLPGFILCEVVFFLGLATLKTSWLILNRNRK